MAGAREFRVDLEALVCSATHVSGQGEDLAVAHVSSDTTIGAAQPGWVGVSAAALAARMDVWAQTSRRLLSDLGAHALDLHTDAQDFAAMERENARRLRALADSAPGAPGRGEPWR
jgi:uncharacterized protein YukE